MQYERDALILASVAMVLLSFDCDRVQTTISDLDGIPAIVSALKNHTGPSDTKIVIGALYVVCTLGIGRSRRCAS